MWFSCSLRANKNEITHYLDGLKGCGAFLENQIRINFFGIIKGLLGQLQANPDETDVKVILNTLRWRYLGKDHAALKHLELFRTLYEGNWSQAGHSSDLAENFIKRSWGKSVQLIVESSEDKKSLTEMIISLFEQTFLSVVGRAIQKDDSSHTTILSTTKSPLSMERSQSLIDENSTENLLLQGFDIIFRELQRYIDFSQAKKGIDWNTYLKMLESPSNKTWEQTV